MTYDFQALSWDEFQLLVKDLLERELGASFESFARGRDGGVDLRLAIKPNEVLVVQVKHYVRTGVHGLLSAVKKEVATVSALKPSRYILATSVSLTPGNKDSITRLLAPFIRTGGDILGQAEINSLLNRFPEVEKQHFKLWMTSLPVMQRVLNSGLYEQAEDLRETLTARARLYVPNPSFARAQEVLRQHRVCIIAGIPGIGKTLLAEMLLIAHIADGYEPVVISRDIGEGNELYKPNANQVFYYDDFLGQAGLAEKELNKNEDARLSKFVARVGRDTSKRFILTTREYILNDVKRRHEKLSEVDALVKCVVGMEDYADLVKARVLYNHLRFSDLSVNALREVVQGRRYREIIDHQNYNPRVVEKVIALANKGKMSSGFMDFFLATLANPATLWRHAFTSLGASGRSMLLVMASMPETVSLEDLLTGYTSFTKAAPDVGEAAAALATLNTLEGTFIRIDKVGLERTVRFHNPAIRDFLLLELNENAAHVDNLLKGAAFFEQPRTLFRFAAEGSENEPRHKGLSSTLGQRADKLLDALIRTIDGKCGEHVILSLWDDESNRESQLHRRFATKEERITLVATVARQYSLTRYADTIERFVVELLAGWSRGEGSHDDLERLLRSVEQLAYPSLAHVPASAKAFMKENFRNCRDVESLLEFGDVPGAELSDAERDEVRQFFENAVAKETERLLTTEDTDEVSSLLALIDDIGDRLGAKTEILAERLQEFLREVQARKAERDEVYNDRSAVRHSSETDADAAIDALFGTLIEPAI